jgi:hypothetical protein
MILDVIGLYDLTKNVTLGHGLKRNITIFKNRNLDRYAKYVEGIVQRNILGKNL